MKIYGYKRWYVVDENKNRKVRIKRKYENGEYVLISNEINGNEEIDDISDKEIFIQKLIEYKTVNDIKKKFKKKFHMGNILFKLKGNNPEKTRVTNYNNLEKSENVILEIEVYKQSEDLRSDENISKRIIAEEIIRQKIDENAESIEIKISNEKTYKIKFDNDENFDENQESTVKWRNTEELELKRELYDYLKSINGNLYNILNNILIKKNFEKRYYIENLKEIIKNEKNKKNISYIKLILNTLFKIKEISSDKTIQVKGFINYYSNIQKNLSNKKKSENKEFFINKIIQYLENNIKIEEEDIIEFLIGELKYWDIIKRIEPKKIGIESSQIKTYIEYDKHQKFKEEIKEKLEEKKCRKNKIVKQFVDYIQNGYLKEKICKILTEFDIKNLKENLNKKIKNNNFDTEIFGMYKEHYQKIFKKEKIKFENMSYSEKELYKIVYRYIKGRIEKILVNKENIKTKKMFIEEVLDFDLLLTKIEKRVKQYTLEHIMYLGKIKHNNIDETTVNTEDFIKLHAKEELDLELITFFSATNMELNKMFYKNDENGNKIEGIDFFGGDRDKKYLFDGKKSNSKHKIIQDLGFINDENEIIEENFISKFIKIATKERNRILHSNDKTRNQKGTSDDYNKVVSVIQNLKTSDDEISKALNLDIVFEGKEKIISEINNIEILEENTNIIKYFPSFSKILPEILNLYRYENKNNPFDTIETERIVENALIYVNKELYKKLILAKDSDKHKFLNELKKTLSGTDEIDEHTIKNYYKNSQVLASKGNNKAIKKYQKKVIECYIEYLKKNYKEIFDFSKFKMNIEEIEKKIKDINDNKAYERKITINSNNINIKIDNDFEYMISIMALLNDNIFINKIRNRFFSTLSWIGKDNSIVDFSYENIINILDEIIKINTLKAEDINNNWEYDLDNEIKKVKEYEDNISNVEKYIFRNNKKEIIQTIKSNNNLKKKNEFLKLIDKKLDKIIIFGDFNTKEKKYKINFECFEKNEKNLIGCNKEELLKILESFFSEKREDTLSKKSKFNSEFLKKYKEIIDNLIESEDKFEKIYYPEKKKNELYIYKKNLFENIGNSNFDKIYNLFREDISKVETKTLFDDEIRNNTIFKVNNVLNKFNNDLKGYSENYKEKYRNNIKDNKFFSYENKNVFMEDYKKVSDYKYNRDLVEFNYLNKLNYYLIDINWKLAIQMARFERDIHYIVNGLERLGIIKIEKNTDNTFKTREDRSMAYNKYEDNKLKETSYYCFCDYKKFEDICYSLGIDLTVNSEVQKPEKESIRNYISHFYIVRELFNGYSIAEQIDRVSNLLSYSTRYNNSTYLSVFEVFKKDVDLNYDNLKKKIKLSEVGDNKAIKKEIKELITPKKVSVLELEHYNSEYIIELIEKLLTTKWS